MSEEDRYITELDELNIIPRSTAEETLEKILDRKND